MTSVSTLQAPVGPVRPPQTNEAKFLRRFDNVSLKAAERLLQTIVDEYNTEFGTNKSLSDIPVMLAEARGETTEDNCSSQGKRLKPPCNKPDCRRLSH